MQGQELDTRRRRAAYRAGHRGTKEMDWLLGRYAEAVLPTIDVADLELLERFLALPDPDLHQWLLNPKLAQNREFDGLIAAVRRFHDLDALQQN